MSLKVRAFAPATVSNVNVGFDILGFAINEVGDEVEASWNDVGKVRITHIEGDNGVLPKSAENNTAGAAVIHLCQQVNQTRGIDLKIFKRMPLGSGLGSSAASAVAACYAANNLFENPLPKSKLFDAVLAGEKIAAGAIHGDNVLPSLMGGFILITNYQPVSVVQLPVPRGLYYAVVHPDIQVFTKEARKILPQQVPLQDAITQTANATAFIAALYENRLQDISHHLTDNLIEPYRQQLIPGFNKVKQAALYGGALGFGISGAAPSLYALCDGASKAEQVGQLMQKTFKREQINSRYWSGNINKKGAVIITKTY